MSLLLANAVIVDPEAPEPRIGGIVVRDGRIRELLAADAARALQGEQGDLQVIDCGGLLLAPGFLDMHFHGELIFHRPDDFAAALARDRARMLAQGVTSFLPTTVSWPRERLALAVEALAAIVAGADDTAGAVPLGLHLEGPWISAEAAGAQPSGGIRAYDPEEGAAALDAAAGLVKIVTLAPEVPGAGQLIQDLLTRDVVIALGHSLATEAEVDAAVVRGATHVTHLWNAMGPLHHRRPGFLGRALVEDRLTCDLICDGVHVHPDAVALAARAKGDRLALITDRVDLPPPGTGPAADSPRMTDDGTAIRLEDGTLAGSSLSLDRALRNVRHMTGWNLPSCIAAATSIPAKVLGIESQRGTLRPGARADLVLLDHDLQVQQTWLAGVSGKQRRNDDAVAGHNAAEARRARRFRRG